MDVHAEGDARGGRQRGCWHEVESPTATTRMRIHRTRVDAGSYAAGVTRGMRRYAGVVIVVLAGLLGGLLVAPAPAQAGTGTLRIMLEGDSITQGVDGDYTWRYRFYRELVRQRVRFDFVGTRTSAWVEPGFRSSSYADPRFDQHHFARAGSTLLVHSTQVHDQVAGRAPRRHRAGGGHQRPARRPQPGPDRRLPAQPGSPTHGRPSPA